MSQQLLTPVRLGALELRNRVVMAPLTRCRTDNPGYVPSAMTARYYAQRASAGLIITEEHSTHPTDWPYEKLIHGFHPDVIPGYRRITEADLVKILGNSFFNDFDRERVAFDTDQESLRALLAQVERFRQPAPTGGLDGDAVVDPRDFVLHEAEQYTHLPLLRGLTRQPYLREDGSLMQVAGYDPSSGMYGVFDPGAFSIPEQPSRFQAHAALAVLQQLLTEFSFAKTHDRSAALAGMLTAAIRPSLPLAPMFHIKAPQIASGKSYLSALIAAFAGPTTPSAYTFPSNDEECSKLLLSALLTGPSVVIFDNLTTDLFPYKSMCSALTEEHLTGRILGVSKTATVGTRTMFLSSGNNVAPIADMTRRVLTIALDPACESPATRRFAGDPLGLVQGARAQYVGYALTIVRAYICAGLPEQNLQPINSYGQWTRLVRSALAWLGLEDPAIGMFESMSDDPDTEMLGRILTAWHDKYQDRPTPIRDAMRWANCDPAEWPNRKAWCRRVTPAACTAAIWVMTSMQ